MNILIDMNLSPDWVSVLETAGHAAMHWSSIGSPSAADEEILCWARNRAHIVFTHDLDFGSILAATNTNSPSVIQIRTPDPTPQHCAEMITKALATYVRELEEGALMSIDEGRARIRILPMRR